MVRVLLVDDNQQKIAQIVRILLEAGIGREAIDVSLTGVDARKHVASTQYNLLILDIALPFRAEDEPDRRGGLKLLEEIVEREIYHRPISVVGLTGYEELLCEFSAQFHANHWTLDQYESGSTGWAERLKAKASYVLKSAQERESRKYETDLCVISGLHSPELTQLRKLDWNWGSAESLDETGFFYRGNVQYGARSAKVVAAAAPRMGMVSSALLTMRMIERFRPRLLAMVGICAGVKNDCDIGDVILADPAWDWQMGKHKDNEFAFAPDQINVPTEIAQRFVQLSENAEMMFRIHGSFSGKKPKNLPSLKLGPVASGSSVLSANEVVAAIRKQHRKLLGIEMELYGVYAAGRDSSLPRPLVFGLKSVCDFADAQKSDDFQEYCAHVSANVLAGFMESFGGDFLS